MSTKLWRLDISANLFWLMVSEGSVHGHSDLLFPVYGDTSHYGGSDGREGLFVQWKLKSKARKVLESHNLPSRATPKSRFLPSRPYLLKVFVPSRY